MLALCGRTKQRLPFSISANLGLICGCFLHRAVQYVVLNDEANVKEHADISEEEFRRIASQAGPVALQRAVDDQLRETQNSAAEIQHLLSDTPTYCGFPAEVRDDLWHVFEKGEYDLYP